MGETHLDPAAAMQLAKKTCCPEHDSTSTTDSDFMAAPPSASRLVETMAAETARHVVTRAVSATIGSRASDVGNASHLHGELLANLTNKILMQAVNVVCTEVSHRSLRSVSFCERVEKSIDGVATTSRPHSGAHADSGEFRPEVIHMTSEGSKDSSAAVWRAHEAESRSYSLLDPESESVAESASRTESETEFASSADEDAQLIA